MAETSVHPRPDMATILKSDNNARGNFMELMEWHRALRHTKFPSIKGKEGHYDFPSFQVFLLFYFSKAIHIIILSLFDNLNMFLKLIYQRL